MRAATRGPNVTWGAHISNGGPGTTAPPLLATALDPANFQVMLTHIIGVSWK